MRHDVLDPAAGRPRHVVGFLFDGANPNVLYDLAAARRGAERRPPHRDGHGLRVRRDGGLPTVTLANHTSILTGRLPGHHGILHNAWYDRARGEQIITNSQATWPWAMQHLVPGSSRSARRRPADVARARFTARCNEPCDLDAGYSTFGYFRARRGPADPRIAPTACPTPPSASCGRRRTTRGRRWSTTWASSRRSASGRPLPRQSYPDAAVPVVQLHAHRLGDARGRPALGDRRRRRCATATPASVRCSPRSSGRASSTTRPSCWSPTTAWRRPTPRCRATGTSRCAPSGLAFRDEGYSFLYLNEA